jgi:hypothetical protein
MSTTNVSALTGISNLARAPSAPATIYAAGGDGSYATIAKSTDAGLTWTTVYSATDMQSDQNFINAIAVDPKNPSHVVAGRNVYHGGQIIATTDGGTTWHPLPDPAGITLEAPLAVAISPRHSNELWVSWSIMGFGKLEHSTDGGVSWTQITTGLPQPSATYALGYDTLSGRLYAEVSILNQPNRIYASLDGVLFEQFAPGATGIGSRMQIVPATGFVLTGDEGTALRIWQIIAPGRWRVGTAFTAYYGMVDGLRLLGLPIGPTTVCGGLRCQYFEKGLLDEHTTGPNTAHPHATCGTLVCDLLAAQVSLPIGGNPSTVTYKTLHALASPALRVAPPPGFHGGTATVPGGTFIPDSPTLARAPGHVVPRYFWQYMAHTLSAPGGWLQHTGLPLTEAVPATVTKGTLGQRHIMVQAFERTVLTYDPLNPASFQVERANIGTDYARTFPERVR